MRWAMLAILLLAGCATPFNHVGNEYHSAVMVQTDRGHGSGVVVEQGVLTAAHVISGRETFRVITHDGEYETNEIALMGEGGTLTDWAIMVVETGIEPAETYCGPVYVGQRLVAVGNPGIGGGHLRTVTWGRVSTIDIGEQSAFSHTVGLDIRAAPGSSGGPVYDEQGRVVGLIAGVGTHSMGMMRTSLMVRLPEEVC